MVSKQIGILNTILCLCLLLFVLSFIQMNDQMIESVETNEDTDAPNEDTDAPNEDTDDDSPRGVYLYQNFACQQFTLTPYGFSCEKVVMNDVSDS